MVPTELMSDLMTRKAQADFVDFLTPYADTYDRIKTAAGTVLTEKLQSMLVDGMIPLECATDALAAWDEYYKVIQPAKANWHKAKGIAEKQRDSALARARSFIGIDDAA